MQQILFILLNNLPWTLVHNYKFSCLKLVFEIKHKLFKFKSIYKLHSSSTKKKKRSRVKLVFSFIDYEKNSSRVDIFIFKQTYVVEIYFYLIIYDSILRNCKIYFYWLRNDDQYPDFYFEIHRLDFYLFSIDWKCSFFS